MSLSHLCSVTHCARDRDRERERSCERGKDFRGRHAGTVRARSRGHWPLAEPAVTSARFQLRLSQAKGPLDGSGTGKCIYREKPSPDSEPERCAGDRLFVRASSRLLIAPFRSSVSLGNESRRVVLTTHAAEEFPLSASGLLSVVVHFSDRSHWLVVGRALDKARYLVN